MNQQKFFDTLEKKGITPERAVYLICRLNSLFEFENGNEEKNVTATITTTDNEEPVTLQSEDPSKKITRLLTSWGFPSNLLGFNYLRKSIMYCVKNGIDISFSKTLYPYIAKECKTTPSRVERAIRHSIETAFSRNSNLFELMGDSIDSNKGKPTNSEFIAFVTDYILNGLL